VAACGKPAPAGPAALLELHTLQALDATLAGASLREVAEGCSAPMPSPTGTATAACAPVRRLVRRGDALMRGGYRRLAQLPPLEKGRFEGAKRP
jgi:hypothetical protein